MATPLGYHLARARKQASKIDLLVDVFESTTEFHRENVDVKIKVGPVVGLLNFLSNALIVFFIIYSILTTNVYMKEEVPQGVFVHWASEGGGSRMRALGKQQLNEDLCSYNGKYDYLYGLDSIWDYSVNGCELQHMGAVAFKQPDSIHFVTYEHRRQVVTVPIAHNGSSCDQECRTVYANWPTSASYGTRSWQGVHVDTKVFAAAKTRHANIANVPNVKMARPDAVEDECHCQSFENIIMPGVEKMEVALSFKYKASFTEGSSKEDDGEDPKSFLMTSSGNVFRDLPKGENVKFSLEEVFQAFNTCMDCQPNASFYMNSLCVGGVCPSTYRPKPTMRVAGSTLDVRTEFYSHKVHMPKGPGYDEIAAKHDTPFAIHIFTLTEDWTSRGSSTEVKEGIGGRTVEMDRYRYGTLVRLAPAAGVVSRFDIGVVVSKLVEFTVLASYPSMIVAFVVFTLLGHKSKLLRAAQRKVITLPELYRSFTYNAILAQETFSRLDVNKNEFLDKEEFVKILHRFFGHQLRASVPDQTEGWYTEKIEAYAELMMNYYQVTDDESTEDEKSYKGISKQDFIDSVLANEPLLWSDMVMKLQDNSVDHGPVDKLCRRRRKNQVGPAYASPEGPA